MQATQGRKWPVATHPLWVRWLAWRNEAPARRPSEMGGGVWVAGVPSRRRWDALRDRGVATVVALTAELAPPAWLRSADELLWLPVIDRQAPSDEQITRASALATQATQEGHGVLFYCGAGLGRAPTAWAGWRLSLGDRLDEVLERLRVLRPAASPTPTQREALSKWEAASRR